MHELLFRILVWGRLCYPNGVPGWQLLKRRVKCLQGLPYRSLLPRRLYLADPMHWWGVQSKLCIGMQYLSLRFLL